MGEGASKSARNNRKGRLFWRLLAARPGEGACLGTSSHIAAWVVIATGTIQPGKAAGSPGLSRLGLAARERVPRALPHYDAVGMIRYS